jgi:hypothetical protein
MRQGILIFLVLVLGKWVDIIRNGVNVLHKSKYMRIHFMDGIVLRLMKGRSVLCLGVNEMEITAVFRC